MPPMSDAPAIVLASASPRRRRMFEDLGLRFGIEAPDIDETRREGESAEELAVRAALEKGVAVAARLAAHGERPFVVSADTVVVLRGDVLGKPRDADEARAMLMRLSGETHMVITGWTVGRDGGPWRVERERTLVTFHGLTARQIDAYVASGDGMDKAGAYAIQGLGSFLVARVDGDYFNVVGLPVSLVVRALVEAGALPDFPP
ncbi:MAG: Maf family protein [Deltaproteobacteria bacterium]|nr:Maf family protein [Deltaproteobacteria bacterium]